MLAARTTSQGYFGRPSPLRSSCRAASPARGLPPFAAATPTKERRDAAAVPDRSVRLTADWRAHDDLAFRYEVTAKTDALWIAAFGGGPGRHLRPIYEGSFDGFFAFSGTATARAEPSRPNRFRIALDIVDPGACNPSGIAHAVIKACRQAREAGIGTQRDVAVRLIVTQLAWVCRADHDTDDYGLLLAACRAQAGPP